MLFNMCMLVHTQRWEKQGKRGEEVKQNRRKGKWSQEEGRPGRRAFREAGRQGGRTTKSY